MILSFLALSALAAPTVNGIDVGDSLDGFTRVGKKNQHLYCKGQSLEVLNVINGDVCVHGKHGVIIDSGWWTTSYSTEEGLFPVYVYHSEDPLTQAMGDFHLTAEYFLSSGFVVADNHKEDLSFSLLLCNEEMCFMDTIEMNELGNLVTIVIQRYP